MRFSLFVAALAITFSATTGCWAQSRSYSQSAPGVFSPGQVRALRDFGAIGDGRSDDTASLLRAFANSDQYCLDGGGRTYRVNGTLRIYKSVCLRNATFLQSFVPADTRPYINGSCPLIPSSSAVVDCGDPAIPPAALQALMASFSVRTLFIRPQGPGTLRVLLDNVKVDRGRYPDGGSRTDSAGIWIEGADGADLRNVEITGDGKGHGISVLRSSNVRVDGLWVHDLVWSPFAGDAPLVQSRVESVGWNSYPIHEFRKAGENGVGTAKFYGVRVQEQLTCALFSQVHNVTIRRARVSRCMARFVDGDLPWQSDGLDISKSSSNVVVDSPVIDETWEGMDVAANGTGIDGLQILSPRVSNSFGFGLKLGKQLRNPVITNATITNAGIAGIVFHGPVVGGSVDGATISGVGILSVNGRTFVPWPRVAHSGVRIDEGTSGLNNERETPRGVDIENVAVSNGAAGPGYAILNKGGMGIRVHGLRASGFDRGPVYGAIANQ